jgi:N,N'-diacetyllegionaminate synthase
MSIKVADHVIGNGNRCFVIAEAGVNHNGKLKLALELVDAAQQAGADAVKFQTFRAEAVVSPIAPKAEYQIANTQTEESQLEMVRELELSYDEFRQVYEHCQSRNMLFLSTPFDAESADFLDGLGMPAFKIPSGEITNLILVSHVASKHKPIILSTGMANLQEVQEALETIYAAGNHDVVVLQCVSNYPASPASINLRAMDTMRKQFGVDVGFSDHTQGIEIPLASVALGATVVEKHFTLDRNLPGPDHKASLEPGELKEMIAKIRNVEDALGNGIKQPTAEELKTAECARRSLVAAIHIPAGTAVTSEMISILRPGTGLRPALMPLVLGRCVLQSLEAGELFALDNLR